MHTVSCFRCIIGVDTAAIDPDTFKKEIDDSAIPSNNINSCLMLITYNS